MFELMKYNPVPPPAAVLLYNFVTADAVGVLAAPENVSVSFTTISPVPFAFNVKLPLDGKYRIKIRHGINNELISQEMIEAEEGDNLLRVYVASLDKSGYMIQLTDEFHNILGNQSFVVN